MIPSFCRVTGNSRNLPKPNYFPLLPPISPAEARSICKLTGKSQSWEDHHYVPVIEFGKESKALLTHCHITQNSEGNEVHSYVPSDDCWQQTTRRSKGEPRGEGCRITSKYQVNSDYVYVFPVLDPPSPTSSKIAHQEWKELQAVLKQNTPSPKNSSHPEQETRYVYPLSDDGISLILPTALEEAVRKGDIESLLLSKAGDKSLLRLRNGKTVSLPMRQLSQEEIATEEPFLYQGGGQESQVLKKQKKIQAYKKRKMSDSLLGCRRRFLDFSNNEMSQSPLKEEEDINPEQLRWSQIDWSARVALLDAGHRSAANMLVFGPDWRDLVYPHPEKWDWEAFPPLHLDDSVPLPPTYSTELSHTNLADLNPGPFISPPLVSNDTVGFEAVPVFETILAPFQPQVELELVQALNRTSATVSQADDIKSLFQNVESAMLLPFIHEVDNLAKSLSSGTPGALLEDTRCGDVRFHPTNSPAEVVKLGQAENIRVIEGLLVAMGGEERFVMGRQVQQIDGAKGFVAGRAVLNHANKLEFQPGIVVQTPDAPGFIPGLTFPSPTHGQTFCPGEILTSGDGQSKFHAGQALQTLHGPKFTSGFTIATIEGPKFVAGHVCHGQLLPGQVLKTQQGPEFITGQTYDSPQGVRFLPGRVVPTPNSFNFVPGQEVRNAEGDAHFAPGYSLETPEGPVFVPGFSLPAGQDTVEFTAGLVKDGCFTPGLLTEKTGQFVVGKIPRNPDGSGSAFVPGKIDPESRKFQASTSLEDVQVMEFEGCISQHWNTWPVSGSSLTAMPFAKPEMGYMKQDERAVKFYRTETNPEGQDAEIKIVSGQLWNLEGEETPRFIPGKLIETAIGTRFVSGQLVRTQRGEQFTPGVVIDSRDNPPKYPPKFIPGQLIETKDGKRFCPGQVLPPTGKKGGPPRFVVGNILQTKYGATFVPSQVMYTDQGSRLIPGNLHMTSQGPRFVPAVLEDMGYGVKFREGTVVETPEGPRFLASDLEENAEGALEFTVQGFEVTPEELRLITAYPFAALHFPLTDDEPLIDSRMLRQMAAAGAAVERYTAQHLHDVKISCPQDSNPAILGANAFNVTEPDLESLVIKASKSGQKSNKSPGADATANPGVETTGPSPQEFDEKTETASMLHSDENAKTSFSQTGLNSSSGHVPAKQGPNDGQLSDGGVEAQTGDCQAVTVALVRHLMSSGSEQTNEVSAKANKSGDPNGDANQESVAQNQPGSLGDEQNAGQTEGLNCSTADNLTLVPNNQASLSNSKGVTDSEASQVNVLGMNQEESNSLRNKAFDASKHFTAEGADSGSLLSSDQRIKNQAARNVSPMDPLGNSDLRQLGNGSYKLFHNGSSNEGSSVGSTTPLTSSASTDVTDENRNDACGTCGFPRKIGQKGIKLDNNFEELDGLSLGNSGSQAGSLDSKKQAQPGHRQPAEAEQTNGKGELGNSSTLGLPASFALHDEQRGTSDPHNSQSSSRQIPYESCNSDSAAKKDDLCQDLSNLSGAGKVGENVVTHAVDSVPCPDRCQGISPANLELSCESTKAAVSADHQLQLTSSPKVPIPTNGNSPAYPNPTDKPQSAFEDALRVANAPESTTISSLESSLCLKETSRDCKKLAGNQALSKESNCTSPEGGLGSTAYDSNAELDFQSSATEQPGYSSGQSHSTVLTTSELTTNNEHQAVIRVRQSTCSSVALSARGHDNPSGPEQDTADNGFRDTFAERHIGVGAMPNTTALSGSDALQHQGDKSAMVTQIDASNSRTPAEPNVTNSEGHRTGLPYSTLTSVGGNNEADDGQGEPFACDKKPAKNAALEGNKNSPSINSQLGVGGSDGAVVKECQTNQFLNDKNNLPTRSDANQPDRGMPNDLRNSLSAAGGTIGSADQTGLAATGRDDGIMLHQTCDDSIVGTFAASKIDSKGGSPPGHASNDIGNGDGVVKDGEPCVRSNKKGHDVGPGMLHSDSSLAFEGESELPQEPRSMHKGGTQIASSLRKGYHDDEKVPGNGSSGTMETDFSDYDSNSQGKSQRDKNHIERTVEQGSGEANTGNPQASLSLEKQYDETSINYLNAIILNNRHGTGSNDDSTNSSSLLKHRGQENSDQDHLSDKFQYVASPTDSVHNALNVTGNGTGEHVSDGTKGEANMKGLDASGLTTESTAMNLSRKDSEDLREKKAQVRLLSKLLNKDDPNDASDESEHNDPFGTRKRKDKKPYCDADEDRVMPALGLKESLISSTTDHANLAVQAFFKRIKSDLDCVEDDPFMRGTLKQAEGLAVAIGRPDLAENVRQLLDILKNSQGDEEMVRLIANILSLKELAENNPELAELLQKVETKPELIAHDQNLKKNLADAIANVQNDMTGEYLGNSTASRSKLPAELPTGRGGQGTKNKQSHLPGQNSSDEVFQHTNGVIDASLSKPGTEHDKSSSLQSGRQLKSANVTDGESQNQSPTSSRSKGLTTDSVTKARLADSKNSKFTKQGTSATEDGQGGSSTINLGGKALFQTTDQTAEQKASLRKQSRADVGIDDGQVSELASQDTLAASSGEEMTENKGLLDLTGNAVGDQSSGFITASESFTDCSVRDLTPKSASQSLTNLSGGSNHNLCGVGSKLEDASGSLDKSQGQGRKDKTHPSEVENLGKVSTSSEFNRNSRDKESTIGNGSTAADLTLSQRSSKIHRQCDENLDESLADSELSQNTDDAGCKSEDKSGSVDQIHLRNTTNYQTNYETGDGENLSAKSILRTKRPDQKAFAEQNSERQGDERDSGQLSSASGQSQGGGEHDSTELEDVPILRRPPRTPKRISVTSRPASVRYSSTELLNDPSSVEDDEDVSGGPTRKTSCRNKVSNFTNAGDRKALPEGEPSLPPIITSAKDIPKEIIDTLRYSTDEAKKELYVEQILDALARTRDELHPSSEGEEGNGDEDEFTEQSSQRRPARFTPRRRSSACVILKDFLETIVPRDAARGVLIGDIDYMVIDEDGVRYFESASGFASRRSSRYDIRLSRAGSSDSSSGPWPWADTAPSSASRSRRCSVDDQMRKARLSRSDLKTNASQPVTRQSSTERLNARRSRYSMPYSRSPSTSAITSLSAVSSRRSSVGLADDRQRRKRKISDVKSSFEETGDGCSYVYHEEHEAVVQKRPISQNWDEEFDMTMGDEALLLLDNSAALRKLAVRPKKKHDARKSSRPDSLVALDSQDFLLTNETINVEEKPKGGFLTRRSRSYVVDTKDPRIKREAVVRELIETEDEFIKDMQHVVERYYNHMESSSAMPRHLQDHRDDLFGPFKKIYEFHQSVLNEGLKYYADEPGMLGRTFLRLERDFDKHVKYCELEPLAQALLSEEEELREYFDDYSVRTGDDKLLSEHLKLPIQRINDYQLLLEELVSYSSKLNENTTDLQKAHELMLSIPQRHSDSKFTANISGYQGNIHKLGRLLRHEWFTVTDNRERTRDRYLFLFKARILVTKVRRITDDRSVFLLKDIIKLPDLKVSDCLTDPPSFKLAHLDPSLTRYPLTLKAHSQAAHEQWLAEIRQYATDAVALAEHAADDLQVEGPSDADLEVGSTQIAEPIVSNLAEETLATVEEPDNVQATTVRSASVASVTDYHSLSQADDYHSMADLNEESVDGTRPRFTHTIRGAFCEPGEKASFECTVDSDPPASITWLKGNRPLDDKLADRVQKTTRDKVHRLSIMNCRLDDAGLYTVHAMNEEGATTCSAQLVVQELTPEEREKMAEQNSPLYVLKLKDAELLEGTSVRFMIKVKGDPNPTVQIKKDGKKLQEDERVKILTDQSISGFYELLITNVLAEDAGLYSCVASNRYGEVLCEANVTVTHENHVFALLPNQSLLEPGEQPVFSWFRDGAQIDPDERFKVLFQDDEDTLALVFQHVKPEDAGLYTCIASTTSGKISCSAELSVQGSVYQLMHPPEPPCILADLTDTEVSCGGSAMMELKVKGYPKPQIIWYREGEEVVAGGRFRFLYEDDESIALIIKAITMNDAGLYTVVAKNELGEVTTEGRLYVKAPPKFKKKMADMACMTEEAFKIKVEVEGSPAPELKWYKDGHLIMESERIKIVRESDETFALMIERVSMDDSGSYSVVASNALGQMSEFWQVIANAPPQFLKALLKNLEGEEGETISFNVAVQGNPKPTVTWTKDGKPIQPDGKKIIATEEGDVHTLTLVGIKRADAGRYGCLITNPYGDTEDTATLNVRAAPKVTQPLADIEAKEGETNVAFTVVADAYPEPKIRWFVDEVEITEERKEFIKSQDGGSHTLVLKEVKTELAGKYTVEVSNTMGSTRCDGTLSVMCKPKVKTGLTDSKVDEGQNAKFTVKVEGVPEPAVKWYKDGNEVSASARIKIKKDKGTHSLSIDSCVAEDVGKYEAKVSNSIGDASTSATFTVDTKPKVVSDNFEYREVYEEEEIRYEIRVTGNPKPEATWFKDQQVITKSERIEITESSETYSLTIKSATMNDAGTYSVKLKNRVGEVSKEEKGVVKSLQELRVPKILTTLKDTVTSKGKQAEFTVRVRGEPKPNVEWLKDGKVISPSKDYVMSSDDKEFTYTLVIPFTKETDAGKYTVRASNQYGSDESSAALTIVLKPEIIVQEELVVKYGEDIFISARINANPKPTVKWVKDGKEVTITERITITQEETYTLRITQSELKDEGTYSLQATNSEGQSNSNTKVKVTAEKPAFVKKPSNITGKAGERMKLAATISGMPLPTAKWTKDGKELQKKDHLEISASEDGRCLLVVNELKASDFGKYTLQITNPLGQEEASVELLLTMEAPTLGESLPKLTHVIEGEPLKLQAKLSGSPLPDTKWYKDNEEIVPDEGCHVTMLPDGTATLEIASAVPTDSGVYKLVAANAAGQVTTQTAADVQPQPKKPKFGKKLEPVTVIQGQPFKLQAQITGYPKPGIKWLKDGRPLRGTSHVILSSLPDGNVALEIDSANPDDAGKYTLVVTNDMGETSSVADVTVEPPPSPPQFTSPLFPRQATEGFPVTMEAKLQGRPTPSVAWLKDGKPLKADGKRVQASATPDSTGLIQLAISEAALRDIGEYEAVATNPEGEVKSAAKLDVKGRDRPGETEAEPGFLTPLKDVSVDEGTPLKLSAKLGGNPIPDVEWKRNGEPLPPSKAKLAFDGDKAVLEIAQATPQDAGEYELTATNKLGTNSSKATVGVRKIYQKPKFIQTFTDLQQLPLYDSKFLAKVSGLPKPDITWLFKGKPIAEDDKYKIKRDGEISVLFVRDCTEADAGKYTCVASNIEGEEKCEAELEIVDKIEKRQKAEPPSFLKKIGDCEVYEGMTAKFTACASGWPEPEFEWFRDDLRLFPSDRIKMEREGSGLLRLTIRHVDEADVGRYKLRVFNPHGEAFCEADLSYDTLDSRPKRPLGDQYVDFDKYRRSGAPLPMADRPIINRLMDRHLTLSWKPCIPLGPESRTPVTYQVEMSECPEGEWFPVRSGIRGCCCEIRNLDPFRDYKFRIRVENKYGVSDPSPYAITYREKLDMEPSKRRTYLPPGLDFHPDSSSYFPKDFDLERPPHDGYSHAPKFLRQEHDAQYGIKNQNCNVHWYVYGYPKPAMTYYFNGELVEMGGRFSHSYTRSGQATLFVNRMLERDVGVYEAVATNEHGEARQRIQVEIAEHPRFIERPEETVFLQRKNGRLQCRISGYPEPEVKWYKDWQPLAASNRVKIQHIDPDIYIMSITDVIGKDEGLYSVVAKNPAGSIAASASVHVEESEDEYAYRTYNRGRAVKPSGKKDKRFEDLYDIGDELGRGTQGVTYHAADRLSGKFPFEPTEGLLTRPLGRNYAAKRMNGDGDLRSKMLNELEIMNQLNDRRLIRLIDAYEDKRSVTLVTELASGGELLDVLTKQPHITEGEIANYIRQVLQGLDHMHSRGYAHLGLTPGDLLFARPGGDELKIGDFGLSRRVFNGKLATLDFGMPEFVSPEIANGEGVGLPADMWSVGIIAYLLLSGNSPFRGDTDRDTLQNVQKGQMDFDMNAFKVVSDQAKDFIAKLLVFQAAGRMDVRQALSHPWLKQADSIPRDAQLIPTDRLKHYQEKYRDWYANASCRTWFRRRPLSGAFTHPSRMVYPPGEESTPRPSPERRRTVLPPPEEPKEFEPIDYELGRIGSESHYQYGPDTYLLQLRDVDFPVRLRRYMKTAANRSPTFALRMKDSNFDPKIPVIRERRRFTDIMDEEIDDERKVRLGRYAGGDTAAPYQPRRLKHEIGLRPEAHAEAEAIMDAKRDGQLPFMREKPETVAMVDNFPVQLSCLAVGDPKPVIQWFKNDVVLTPGPRIKITEEENGRSILRFEPANTFDMGVYKVVARNKWGQTMAKARILLGDLPGVPDSPEVAEISDTEVLLRWRQPRFDGNAPILCYALEFKAPDANDWQQVASNIDHEFYIVRNLQPSKEYHFRMVARNKFGWGDKSILTESVTTKESGCAKVSVTRAMKYLQQLTEAKKDVEIVEEEREVLDYHVEKEPLAINDQNPRDSYNFIGEISRGRFSCVMKCANKFTDRLYAAKIIERGNQREDAAKAEIDHLRATRHERLASAHEIFASPDFYVVLMEKLQGLNILAYLAERHEYTEEIVANVIGQVLDGLQYLHWRGLAHLNLQPDNVVLTSTRNTDVKIVDLGSAKRVSKMGIVLKSEIDSEFAAPELLNDEAAYQQTDVWSVGVLTYLLLSGVSPFRGETPEETRQNITYVRYRFDHLYKEITMEANRFLMLVFKRAPNKRPTAEECMDHRWLQPSEHLRKKRERAVFLGNRLKEYSDGYHGRRASTASKSENLLNAFGLGLNRSVSLQNDIYTTF